MLSLCSLSSKIPFQCTATKTHVNYSQTFGLTLYLANFIDYHYYKALVVRFFVFILVRVLSLSFSSESIPNNIFGTVSFYIYFQSHM